MVELAHVVVLEPCPSEQQNDEENERKFSIAVVMPQEYRIDKSVQGISPRPPLSFCCLTNIYCS